MAQPRNLDHRVVQTSAVYILGCPNHRAEPPPSPPSPLSPQSAAESDCDAIEELDLQSSSPVGASETLPLSLDEIRTQGAVHVLRTEATALQKVSQLYETDSVARKGFDRAVDAITRHGGERGKLVIIGVGKSGHIAKKLVATFNSLGVHATFLHPTEALHGDLGTVGKHDTILFITFSGKTQELLSVLPHIDPSLPQIILTSHVRPETCEIIRQRENIILLPAPIHEPEALSFGVCAPTTSTTIALAVGDALAVVTSQELHSCVAAVFANNHPGGAIGAANGAGSVTIQVMPSTIAEIGTAMAEIAVLNDCIDHSCAEVLRAGYSSKGGWVRIGDSVAPPTRIRRLRSEDLTKSVAHVKDLLVHRRDMLALSARTDLRRARDIIKGLVEGGGGETEKEEGSFDNESVVAIVEEGETIGVLEISVALGLDR